ncbi:MAG: epoxyqueuosine reductase QueH [Nitrospinae bacterium]|nr:epoxyqueuosine reductase QueH [Nitrospinota bacterium]
MKPRLLLHVCCAPCSPHVVEKLREEYDVILYFNNPNIHPKTEYENRLNEVVSWAGKEGLTIIVENYAPEKWFAATTGMENEPERGKRCETCFDLRLTTAAGKAKELGIGAYGSVLSVSPRKDAAIINRVGERAGYTAGVKFLTTDWKKKDGSKATVRMGRELGFYRQDYCGCVFSLKERQEKAQKKEAKTIQAELS